MRDQIHLASGKDYQRLRARKAFKRSLKIMLDSNVSFLDKQHFDECIRGVPVKHLGTITEAYNAKYKQSTREASLYMLRVSDRVQAVRHAH